MVGAVGGGAVAHHQHAMVQRSAALGIKHAAAIQLEGALQAGSGRQECQRIMSSVWGGCLEFPSCCNTSCPRHPCSPAPARFAPGLPRWPH